MSPRTRKPGRTLRHAAPVFAALGDRTRLMLVDRLSGASPQSISRLTEGSAMTRQAVTKHLRVLRDAGLVRDVRRGRESLYELRPEALDEARQALETIARQWDDALARLKAFVEAGSAPEAEGRVAAADVVRPRR